MKGSDFLELDGLKTHETLRDQMLLKFIDTMALMAEFNQKFVTVFFSHQWVAFGAPDPEGEQFRIMCSVIKQLVEKTQRPLDEIYVWVECVAGARPLGLWIGLSLLAAGWPSAHPEANGSRLASAASCRSHRCVARRRSSPSARCR
jgi:hypothetical protein